MINEEFRYKRVYEKGKPEHSPYDNFSIKHPSMDLSRRAKIFSPFDALKGFDEELASTQMRVEESYLDIETEPFTELP